MRPEPARGGVLTYRIGPGDLCSLDTGPLHIKHWLSHVSLSVYASGQAILTLKQIEVQALRPIAVWF